MQCDMLWWGKDFEMVRVTAEQHLASDELVTRFGLARFLAFLSHMIEIKLKCLTGVKCSLM